MYDKLSDVLCIYCIVTSQIKLVENMCTQLLMKFQRKLCHL